MKDDIAGAISKTSHDLRNALSVIYSYAQLLELSLERPDTREELASAQGLSHAVKDMEALLTERVDELKKTIAER
jgi:signal transduction histidine kinase